MTDDDLKAIATYLKTINGLDRQQAESRLLLGGIGVEDGTVEAGPHQPAYQQAPVPNAGMP
jgi:hypothetical protein